MTIPRRLEPEVMDTADEARDYDAMDHSEVNRQFAGDFLEFLLDSPFLERRSHDEARPRVLDVGTGTALIPIEICRRIQSATESATSAGPDPSEAVQRESRSLRITAVDLAGEMLKLAERNVRNAGLADRIEFAHVDAKRLPYSDDAFDAVVSNSIIHHVPEPLRVLREMRRVLRPEGVLFVRDLLRPTDEATLDALVAEYAGDESSHARQMFRDSLHAALTLDELRHALTEAGIPGHWARQTSDRHWTVAGRIDKKQESSEAAG